MVPSNADIVHRWGGGVGRGGGRQRRGYRVQEGDGGGRQ